MPWWPQKHVVITGATGFLGSWLCKMLLANGAVVTGMATSHPSKTSLWQIWGLAQQIRLYRGQIQDRSFCRRVFSEIPRVDVVFHLAASTQVSHAFHDPTETFSANIQGTWNLLDSLRRSESRPMTILLSSDLVYGDSPHTASTEESTVCATSPYAVSKICSEWIAKSFAKTYGLQTLILRPSNLFGGGDFHLDRLIPGTIVSVLNNLRPTIRGSGNSIRDFLYVQDAVEACCRIPEALMQSTPSVRILNLSSQNPVSVMHCVKTILKLMEREDLTPHIRCEETEQTQRRWTSSDKAFHLLGWKPRYSFETGLRHTIDWYQRHRHLLPID